MSGKKILFFVGKSYMSESAAFLSFKLRKSGYFTSIFCPFLNKKYTKCFDAVCNYFSLDNWFVSLFVFPSFLLYLIYLVMVNDVVVIYQVRLSFFIRFWCILLRKKFFVVHYKADFSWFDALFSRYANKLFYLFATTNISYENACLSGLPLSFDYKFSYIQAPVEKIVVSFFVDNAILPRFLDDVYKLLDVRERDLLELNVVRNKDVQFNCNLKIKVLSSFNESDLIRDSHLIVCCANSLILSKVCAIGRPVCLMDHARFRSNKDAFLRLNKGAFGDASLLVRRIRNYLLASDCYYGDCTKATKLFAPSVIEEVLMDSML